MAQVSMWWAMTGSPATGNSGLGVLKESGRKRVPREGPPMRMTALAVAIAPSWVVPYVGTAYAVGTLR